jgi:hypothetical protein
VRASVVALLLRRSSAAAAFPLPAAVAFYGMRSQSLWLGDWAETSLQSATRWCSPDRRWSRARLAHVLCGYVAALAALAPAAWAAGAGPAVAATARGLVGYDAAALLAVAFLGAARSWVPVLCLGVAALSLPLPSSTSPWLWGWTGADVRGPAAWLSAAAIVLLARLASGVTDRAGPPGLRARGARRPAG